MRDKIRDAFSEVMVSSSLEDEILNKTINKKEEKSFKYAYMIISCLIGIIGLGTFSVYGDELKDIIQSWSSKVEFESGEEVKITEASSFKNIPDDMPEYIEGKGKTSMRHSEIEEVLGFNILFSDMATSDRLGYSSLLNPKDVDNPGKIGRVDLWYAKFIEESEDKQISMNVAFLTQYAWWGQVDAFEEGLDATGGKELDGTYYVENLDTNVVIFGNDWDSTRLTAIFEYDDILYELIANNYTSEELIEVIESMK